MVAVVSGGGGFGGLTFYVFRSCFRTLAVILVSDFSLKYGPRTNNPVLLFSKSRKHKTQNSEELLSKR